jgi:hypothetical protein
MDGCHPSNFLNIALGPRVQIAGLRGVAPIEGDRASVTLAEFVDLLERRTGHVVEDLASSRKTFDLTDGRVELTLLGISRYRFRSTELAEIINKHPSSLTRWLNEASLASAKTRAFEIAFAGWTTGSQQQLKNE